VAVSPQVLLDPILDAKRQNFRRTLEILARCRPAGEVPNRPLLLHLEITSRCNLRCLKCGHATDPPGTARIAPRHLAYRIIETFDDFFSAAVRIHTFGYGEMFLYSKLRLLVERLKNFGCYVDGITNGVLVGEAEADWLVEYGYDELTFSIDGVEPETMQRLRGVDVEKLWRTLEYLKKRKAAAGKDRPKIIVNFVAQADNYHELPALVRKLADLGIHFLGVNPLMPAEDDGEAYAKLYREFGLENVPREKVEAVLNETRALARSAGIEYGAYIDLDSLYASRYGSALGSGLLQILPAQHLERIQKDEKLQPYYCAYPWTSIYVHANTGSRVCCYMDGIMGNIEDSGDMERVWSEGVITEVRDAISKGDVHPACRSCVQLGRYQHSYTDVEDMRRHLEIKDASLFPAALLMDRIGR
jgi:MoaA/NifB/PqqE/SkfB family radical SAM enzyme